MLNLVEESGCMPYVMLIGSWAEFAYREARLLGDFAPSIKTMDVDFLVRNLRKPTPSAGLAAAAREKGFYVEADRIDGTTRIIDTTGLEVEFLIGKKGAGLEASLKINLGVTAQALRHLDILSKHPVVAQCLGHEVGGEYRFNFDERFEQVKLTLDGVDVGSVVDFRYRAITCDKEGTLVGEFITLAL